MPITVFLAAAAVAAALPLLWWSVAGSRLGVKTIDRSVLAGGHHQPRHLRGPVL
jgi:hypothetical protein